MSLHSVYYKWQRAFEIFAMYPDTQAVSAEHDQVQAGPDPETVSETHLDELTELGWHPDDEYDCFYKFT